MSREGNFMADTVYEQLFKWNAMQESDDIQGPRLVLGCLRVKSWHQH